MVAKEILNKSKVHTRYELKDGTYVPGATTILGLKAKPGLVPWANKLGLDGIDVSKFVDELAEIGTLSHYLVECHLKDELPELGDFTPNQLKQAQKCVDKFHGWLAENKFKMIFSEKPLVSEKFKFGGTIDLYGELNGKKTLIDIKTSKATYPEHFMQTSAYSQLLAENGYEVEDVRIIRIGRNDNEGFDDKKVSHLKTYWQIFKHLLEIYHLEKEIKAYK